MLWRNSIEKDTSFSITTSARASDLQIVSKSSLFTQSFRCFIEKDSIASMRDTDPRRSHSSANIFLRVFIRTRGNPFAGAYILTSLMTLWRDFSVLSRKAIVLLSTICPWGVFLRISDKSNFICKNYTYIV